MARGKKVSVQDNLIKKKDDFINKIDSDMHYVSAINGSSITFDYVDVLESSCPFIDNIVRNPKLTLIQDEIVVPTEKAKRIMAASIKDLAKHSNYIQNPPKDGEDYMPSKILDIRSEETYNIYENRFLYTLITDLDRFLYQKEQLIKNLDLTDEKELEYSASTNNGEEKISIELKVTTSSLPKEKEDNKLQKEVERQKKRLKEIREYVTSWQRSEMVKQLEKAHVQAVKPPLKPSNILLKNPNFQVATKLWEYIRNYDLNVDNKSKEDLESSGNKTLLSFLDDAFLKDYFVLDSISKRKREEKEKICDYAIVLLAHEFYKTLNLLLDNGKKIDEQELLSIIAEKLKAEEKNKVIGVETIKNKFKAEINEYLERIQDL